MKEKLFEMIREKKTRPTARRNSVPYDKPISGLAASTALKNCIDGNARTNSLN